MNQQKEITAKLSQVYIFSFYLFIPLIILFYIPYFLLWKDEVILFSSNIINKISNDWNSLFFYLFFLRDIFYIMLFIVVGAVLHEILHGLVWVIYTGKGFKILKFGIMPSDLSPYVHCNEPLPMRVYRIGIVLPAIVLGIIPALIALVIGNGILFFLGFFFTWAASGDILVMWLTRKLASNTIVKDHPEKVGCIVIAG